MPNASFGELNPPSRTLLGPGPTNVHPRVLQALTSPLLGYLDPSFFAIADEVMEMLRMVFKTSNIMTLPISGTGTAGMEATLVNLVEPGDTAIIGVNGFFAERIREIASRCGAQTIAVPAEWGCPVEPDAIEAALKKQGKAKVVALVHAETSTGVLQPLEDISRLTHQYGAFFLVDAVTSLGGCNLAVDEWGLDACYSGTQKCLSCPPGLAPITLSKAAMDAVRSRRSKIPSWYFDLTLIEGYWTTGRTYHHTPPMSMIYALREALRIVLEEGLEARFARHQRNAHALQAGLEAMGLGLLVPSGFRAPSLTTVKIPPGVEDMPVRRALLDEFNIEIGGGLGSLRGAIWRIGLMGYSSTEANVLAVLSALERILPRHGFEVAQGVSVAAAQRALASQT